VKYLGGLRDAGLAADLGRGLPKALGDARAEWPVLPPTLELAADFTQTVAEDS